MVDGEKLLVLTVYNNKVRVSTVSSEGNTVIWSVEREECSPCPS